MQKCKRSLSSRFMITFVYVMIIGVFLAPVLSQKAFAQYKKPVSVEDFGVFQRVSQQQISHDGQWVAYYQKPAEGDGTLFIKNLNSSMEYEISRGTRPVFTDDSNWIAYVIIPHEKSDEEKKAEKEALKESKDKKKPPEEKNKLEFMNLRTGQKTLVDRLSNFKFSGDSKWIAYKLIKPEKEENSEEKEKAEEAEEKKEEEVEETPGEKSEEPKKTIGTEIVLYNLSTGSESSFQEVDQYFFSENSEVLYFTISSEEDANDGIFFRDLSKTGEAALPLATGKGSYKNLVWNEDDDEMLFLSDYHDQESDDPSMKVYSWKINSKEAKILFDPQDVSDFPNNMELASSGARFTKNGKSVFFRIIEREEKKEDSEDENDDEEKEVVDIWHWKDLVIQSQQRVRASNPSSGGRGGRGGRGGGGQQQGETFQVVYHVKDKDFVQLTDDKMTSLSYSNDDSEAIGTDRSTYEYERPWSPTFADYYIVDIKDGSRKKLEMRTRWNYRWSDKGEYFLQYIQPHWWVFDPEDGSRRNLTENIEADFWNTDDDHPNIKRAWGSPGWSKDDEGVLLYDKYDIWYVPVKKEGEPVNVTAGLGREIDARFRYWREDPDEEFIDLEKPIKLSYFNNKNKDTGYYEVTFGEKPRKITTVSKRMGNPVKAEDSDMYMFTMSTFEEYGNIWVSDGSFSNKRQMSFANNDNNGFTWGTTKVIDYTNSDGVKLQALLTLPDSYREGDKLPMIVYMYEKLTQNLHSYSIPATGSGFSASFFASQGYAVLQPDIIYTDGFPGPSSVKCLVPATQKVIDMGIADPEHIALTGHSWGGYQTAFTITQTDIYAAAYAGAPVSNMSSAYGGIRWGSGNPRTFQYETGQSRIGGTLWEYPERYIANSPLFHADKINTPIMLLHGDEDTAVPWYQSIEFYLALRRLDKPVWFLQYNGEPHGLRSDEAKKDFAIRRLQFFDHYLKGKEMPKWMEEGVKFRDKGSIK